MPNFLPDKLGRAAGIAANNFCLQVKSAHKYSVLDLRRYKDSTRKHPPEQLKPHKTSNAATIPKFYLYSISIPVLITDNGYQPNLNVLTRTEQAAAQKAFGVNTR